MEIFLNLVLLVLLLLILWKAFEPNGVENDLWIEKNAELLGVSPKNINPASVDICLGGHIIEFDSAGNSKQFHLEELDLFTFLPGKLYIAHSVEKTYCPPTHAWMLMLKSSAGRRGLDHLHAGWGDPGFEGQITFELTAMKPTTFRVGERIAQLVYMRLSNPPANNYANTGRYQGQRGATLAR